MSQNGFEDFKKMYFRKLLWGGRKEREGVEGGGYV